MDIKFMSRASLKVYGSRFSLAQSAGKRMLDAQGKNFTKATDLTAGTDDFKLIAPFNVYRAIVKYIDSKAQIVAREGDANFATYVANKDGDVYTMFPKYWYRRTQEANGDEIWQVSPFKIAGFSPSPLHYRNGVMHDWVGISSYQLGENGADAQSMPGLPLKVNIPWTSFNTIQRAKGLYVADYAASCHMQILGSIKYNNLNWQNVIGQGIGSTYTGDGSAAGDKATVSETGVKRIIVANACAAKFAIGDSVTLSTGTFFQSKITAIDVYDASNKAITINTAATFNTTSGTTGIRRSCNWTGETDSLLGTDGMPTGTDGKTSVKTLGVENWYANAWNLSGGAFRYNNVDFYVNTNIENINAWPTTIEEAIANGYVKLDGSLPTSNGYVQTMNYDKNMPFATILETIGGTSNSPVGDYFYTTTGNGFYIVQLGGGLSNGSCDGPADAAVNGGLANASWNIGAFGLYLPEQAEAVGAASSHGLN